MTAVQRHWLALVIATTAIATCVASLANAPVPIRAPLVLVFAILGPGAGTVPLLGIHDPLGELTLAIGVSLACDVVIALIMLYVHAWAPEVGLAILVSLTLAGAGAQVATDRRRR